MEAVHKDDEAVEEKCVREEVEVVVEELCVREEDEEVCIREEEVAVRSEAPAYPSPKNRLLSSWQDSLLPMWCP